jgi:TRAP-type uncharacterized transport system fused permease subunit
MVARNTIMAILGAWFVVSSFILHLTHHPVYTVTSIVLGALTLAGAIWAIVERRVRTWRHVLMAIFGLWFAASPWLLGFSHAAVAMPVTLILGLAVIALGLWESATEDQRQSGERQTSAA